MSDRPVIVLVRPQMGENIGAAARAMRNFGLRDLRLVAPRDGWPNPKAAVMAAGASDVLDEAVVFDSLAAAIGDCTAAYATTARPRDMTKPVLDPEATLAETARRIAGGERVALVFGPERAGLENEDIARATAIVTVPVAPDFPSLNLAQCVLLMGYEWRRRQVLPTPPGQAPELASIDDTERFATHWEERLAAAGFFFPEAKAPHMRRAFRNLWSRMPLTSRDVQMLHGALRQLVRRRDRAP